MLMKNAGHKNPPHPPPKKTNKLNRDVIVQN